MARKPRHPKSAFRPILTDAPNVVQGLGYTVTQVRVKARRLVTIGPDELARACGVTDYYTNTGKEVSEDWKGAIVRLQPPGRMIASDEDIEGLRKNLLSFGAAAVRVLPRPSDAPVVLAKGEPSPTKAEAPRAVAKQLVDEANTGDRTALAEAVEAALDTAGL